MYDARSIDMTTAPRFGRRPVNAVQLDGDVALPGHPIPDAQKSEYLWATTPDQVGHAGDWLCEAHDGTRFIVSAEKFTAEFEALGNVATAKKAPAKPIPATD